MVETIVKHLPDGRILVTIKPNDQHTPNPEVKIP